MDIVLYSGVDKRINSTKRPTGAGTTFSGVLKEGCSVLTPVVLIEAGNLSGYNYALISAFGRYYYITDIVSINNLWEVHMKVDPMSSNRDLIGALSVYVERADADFDGEVMDNLYPGKTTLEASDISLATSWSRVTPNHGTFVVGIINNRGIHGGAVCYYALSFNQMLAFMSYLLSDTFLSDNGFPSTMTAVQQISQSVAKAIVRPIDYIASCMWFPVTGLEGDATTVKVGYWELDNIGASTLGTVWGGIPFGPETIPAHPQAQTRGNYLNHAPYTELLLRLPPFGVIPINPDYFVSGVLNGTLEVDYITGKGHLRVMLDGKIVAETSGLFGIPIQIAQITPDYLDMISNAANLAGNVISGNLDNTIFNSIGNAANSFHAPVSSSGTNGSFLTTWVNPFITVKHTLLVDEDKAELGRPLCQVRTVNTLPGYIKCAAVPDTIPRTQAEKDEITSMMMGGFFFE